MSDRKGDIPAGGKPCRVTAEHRASFPEGMVISAGEELTVQDRETFWQGWVWCVNRDGMGAWVPEVFVEMRGDNCVALRDYDSIELTVAVGDNLQAYEEAGGWLWCLDGEGRWGWVPASCVKPR